MVNESELAGQWGGVFLGFWGMLEEVSERLAVFWLSIESWVNSSVLQ